MKFFLSVPLLFIAHVLTAQFSWHFQQVADMPEPVSNNAVVGWDGSVYSFGGIAQGKTHDDIHLRSFRYDVEDNTWQQISDVPDSLGKIAMSASVVKGKIYLIGGYHVFSNSSEASSHKVHVFDPVTNTFLSDAVALPVPIDDHIQAVWRDSLIYVITGWSNTTNVTNVQVYNPSSNTWQVATSVPVPDQYRVFGGSGVIKGDTIFYIGGAGTGFNFPITSRIRMGIIDPDNPLDITWSTTFDTLANAYRSAAEIVDDHLFWFGGSETTYNFDGIAYDGSGGVEPTQVIRGLNTSQLIESMTIAQPASFPQVMDLRGLGVVSNREFVVAGGMESAQQVSNKTYIISFTTGVGNGLTESHQPSISIRDRQILVDWGSHDVRFVIHDIHGKSVLHGSANHAIDIASLSAGIYLITLESNDDSRSFTQKISLVK